MVAECQPEMSAVLLLNLLAHQFDEGAIWRPPYAKAEVIKWVLNLTELVDVRISSHWFCDACVLTLL